MEPITAIVGAITQIIFGEALKESGKALGKSSSDKVSQLITAIRQKFQESGTQGSLTRAENKPTQSNIAIVEAELVAQMTEDELFARKLHELVKQLEKLGATRQVMLSDIKANKLEVEGDMNQKGGGEQIMATNLEISGDVKFVGNLTQDN